MVYKNKGVPASVYARIAEHVQAVSGIETDSIEVMTFMHDEYDSSQLDERSQVVYDEVQREARTYPGLELA